jgi:hypothetical protein
VLAPANEAWWAWVREGLGLQESNHQTYGTNKLLQPRLVYILPPVRGIAAYLWETPSSETRFRSFIPDLATGVRPNEPLKGP